MTDTLAALIERLEKAEAGTFALDREIAEAVGWQGMEKGRRLPCYTTSIDAALTLVPEGWTSWEVGSRAGKTRFRAEVSRLPENHIEDAVIGHARAPALALCIAALRAKEPRHG